jgi:hypothetical protein
VADGGPSLAGTWGDVDNDSQVAAVNGSLGFLFDNCVVPRFCAVMDVEEAGGVAYLRSQPGGHPGRHRQGKPLRRRARTTRHYAMPMAGIRAGGRRQQAARGNGPQ